MSPELERVLNEARGPRPTELDTILDDIRTAHMLIRNYIPMSPLRKSFWLSELTGGDIWLKLECLNPKGSFKIRGAINAIWKRLSEVRKVKGEGATLKVCAASAGNHAQGVALAARFLGCEAHIFLPRQTPLVKRQSTEKLGARVYLAGENLEDAFEAAVVFAKKENAELIHAYNDYEIIVGQGTCALEAFDQFEAETGRTYGDIDSYVCSVGGGGLAAGAGIVMKALGQGRVFGVEQKNFDSAARSFEEGKRQPVTLTGLSTIADGIAVRVLGNLTYEYLKHGVEKIMLVSDEHIVGAVLGLCEHERIVAEGAGAAAVAAVLRHPELFCDKTTIVCVSGGNIDPQLLTRVIARGLTVTGRVLNLTAKIGDKPGHLKGLLEQIASLDVNVLEVHHDRTYSQVNVGEVGVELALETKNFEHQYELIERLGELGYEPKIPHP